MSKNFLFNSLQMKGNLVVGLLMMFSIVSYAQNNVVPMYKNTKAPIEDRVNDLVSRMSLEDKIKQMGHFTPAIPSLGVKSAEPYFHNPYKNTPHDWVKEFKSFEKNRSWEDPKYQHEVKCLDGGFWNEALHGVARSGLATVFPQVIGLGATFNPSIIHRMADVISDEARVHHQVYGKRLTYWSPTINMLRDPRWGRTEESYSEDPYLQGMLATAFVKGMQGTDPMYLKTVATIKHFAANNSEFNRHDGSSNISERQLREYYFPAFKMAIKQANVFSLMGAYNAVNGVPSCANKWLLTDILRKEWGFNGFVVSDCGAISDIVHGHHFEEHPEKAVALAVKAGTDMECETCEEEQFLYKKYLPGAVKKGYIDETTIDRAVKRIFTARFKLGEFNEGKDDPFANISIDKLDSPENRKLALKIAQESITLLKNENNFLPFDASKNDDYVVIGPNGNIAVLGGYSGTPPYTITTFQGVRDKVGFDHVAFEEGAETQKIISWKKDRAIQAAKNADKVILCLGTNLSIATEGKDRKNLNLPEAQVDLMKAIYAVNKNVVLVLINGMPLTINWASENIPAIVEAWYPGQAGGQAIADVLFGDYNPSGKLPITFYKNLSDLPPIEDYDIAKGRTYWYFKGEVLYPFGHGLSYTTFSMTDLTAPSKATISKGGKVTLTVKIKNTGKVKGDEVVQLYIRDLQSKYSQPIKKLRRFNRITLEAGEEKLLKFDLDKEDFSFWNPKLKRWYLESGKFEIQVGASSQDIKQQHTLFIR